MNCKTSKTDCAAYCGNGCVALEKHAERSDGKCPFYRSKKDQLEEDEKCLKSLEKRGKYRLIELYRGKKL